MAECKSGRRGGLLWKEPLLSSLLAGFYDNMFEFKASQVEARNLTNPFLLS